MSCCNTFSWNTFWTALGAIATAAACIISLWQSHSANARRLKITCNFNSVIMKPIAGYSEKVIDITCANPGQNTIWIRGIKLQIDDRYYQQLPIKSNITSITFPYELYPGASVTYPISKEAMQQHLQNHNQFGQVRVIVTDSLGHQYQYLCTEQVRNIRIDK